MSFLSSLQLHEIDKCVVRDNGTLGIGVNTGASATISGSTLLHNGFGTHPFDAEGLLVAGNASVTVKGGAVVDNRLWGVNVSSPGVIGATLILDGVDIHDNGQHGVRAAGGKSVKVIGGKLRGHAAGAGLSLEARAEVSLEGALVEGNSTGILELLPQNIPAKLSLAGCTLRKNELRGLLAQSPDLSLSLGGCTFEINNTSGSPEQADLLLARPAKGGSLAVQLSGLTFDGVSASPSGAQCGAGADLTLGGKNRLLNLSDGCVAWSP